MKKRNRFLAYLLSLLLLVSAVPFGYVNAADISLQDNAELSVSENVTETDKQVEAEEVQIPENNQWKEAQEAFTKLLYGHSLYAMLYKADSVRVMEQPSDTAAEVANLPSGYSLQLTGFVVVNNQAWYQAKVVVSDVLYTAYVKNANVISANTGFREWKISYGIDRIGQRLSAAYGTNLDAFPESYRPYIQSLLNQHPNWEFVPMNTGLKWADVIRDEMSPRRNLVPSYSAPSWRANDVEIEPGWVQATDPIVRYYMDPRNSLNEEGVFQFEWLGFFNGNSHTEGGTEAVLRNTFMSHKGLEDGSGGTYAQVFCQIGQSLNVSPYFLASRVRQEQGVKGDSLMISGNYPGFEGYYNYFNIKATGSTREEIYQNGLTEARDAGWTTRYEALNGGANKATANYIRRGQDTPYLQKFDVDSSYDGVCWHQYMTNLLAPTNEGKTVRSAYAAAGLLGNDFVFRVPVYTNMPSSAVPAPPVDHQYQDGDAKVGITPSSKEFVFSAEGVSLANGLFFAVYRNSEVKWYFAFKDDLGRWLSSMPESDYSVPGTYYVDAYAVRLDGSYYKVGGNTFTLGAPRESWTGPQGETWKIDSDGLPRCYDANGNQIKNAFQCDGTYTYFFQADGSPMTNRLTYHPDGENLIYFDEQGHEVFDHFQYCKDVKYTCYFNTYGYLRIDEIVFSGGKPYYLDKTGAMKQNEWFYFGNGVDIGYANADGSLKTGGWGTDPWGRQVFYHWNGMVARGLITDSVWYYHMDEKDGHLRGQFR
ncbi:hypothetical protein FACS1894111_07810 [Clostridia bacterium]|nr:hypothetical protein FACS1894111_07810 [Clostridia bacterium]